MSSVTGFAVEVAVFEAGLVEAGGRAGEEPGELAEDQDAVAFGGDVGQLFQQGVEFGAGDGVVGGVEQADVEGGLPEQGEGAEDFEAVAVQVAE